MAALLHHAARGALAGQANLINTQHDFGGTAGERAHHLRHRALLFRRVGNTKRVNFRSCIGTIGFMIAALGRPVVLERREIIATAI
jgi:hypothetical protein